VRVDVNINGLLELQKALKPESFKKASNRTVYEAEKIEDTQKFCGCGIKLTWNDSYKLKTFEGKR